MASRILVATNGSPAATAAVRRGIALARAESAELVFLHVAPWDDPRVARLEPAGRMVPVELEPSAWDLPLQEARSLARAAGVPCSSRVLAGDVLAAILAAADAIDPDLIVIGSHRHPVLSERLGQSLSDAVIARSHRDVLVVPAAAPGNRIAKS